MLQVDEQLKGPCFKLTYDYFEVVAGDDGVSVLHPLDGGSWRAGDLALKHNVHGLVGVNVGWPFAILGGNCGTKHRSCRMLRRCCVRNYRQGVASTERHSDEGGRMRRKKSGNLTSLTERLRIKKNLPQ